MKNKDLLRIEQLEEAARPFRRLIEAPTPIGGWIRAVREALGMSSAQLAKRMKMRAPQSIEDIQKSEVTGSIQLQTLKRIAEALECRLVYALVPIEPLPKLRRNRARRLAEKYLGRISHSMKLEAQELDSKGTERQLKLLTEKILTENPKRLWE